MLSLPLFLVGDYGDNVDEDGEDGKHDIVERQVLELASLEAYRTEDIDKICRRQDIGEVLRPCLHRADRGEYPAHKHEYQDKEEHKENGLKQCVGIIGYQKTEPRHEYQEEYRPDIEFRKAAVRGEPVDEMPYQERQGEGDDTEEPVEHHLGKDEIPLADRRDIDLLYGTRLLLRHDAHRGKEASYQDYHHYHHGRHHEELVVQMRVVPETGCDFKGHCRHGP